MRLLSKYKFEFIFLSCLILIKIALQAYLYRAGFISLSADEFARGISAATWSQNPQIGSLASNVQIWLPFEKFLNGIALMIWDDVIWAPRLTAFLASVALLVAVFALARVMFASSLAAAFAATFVVFQPWYAWLSGTPMLEIYFLACFFAGFTFLLIWLREQRRRYWIYGGIFFFLASGFHLHSWLLINVVNLLTAVYLYKFIRQKQFRYAAQLVGMFFLSNLLILVFSYVGMFMTGTLAQALGEHKVYSRWFYGGYDVSLIEKILFYPNLVWQNVDWPVWVFTILGLWAIRKKAAYWQFIPLLTAALSLFLYMVFNVNSGPPSAAAGRYTLVYTLLLAPYVGYGGYFFYRWAANAPNRRQFFARLALPAACYVWLLALGLGGVVDFPQTNMAEPVAAGRYLEQLLDAGDLPPEQAHFMVEVTYWEFIAVQLAAKHYDEILFDRPVDLYNRDLPSLFLENPPLVKEALLREGVTYVALQDTTLKANAQAVDFLTPLKAFGDWMVYRFTP